MNEAARGGDVPPALCFLRHDCVEYKVERSVLLRKNYILNAYTIIRKDKNLQMKEVRRKRMKSTKMEGWKKQNTQIRATGNKEATERKVMLWEICQVRRTKRRTHGSQDLFALGTLPGPGDVVLSHWQAPWVHTMFQILFNPHPQTPLLPHRQALMTPLYKVKKKMGMTEARFACDPSARCGVQ